MKKSLLIICVFSLFCLSLQAQEHEVKHEIRASVSDGFTLTVGSALFSVIIPRTIDEVSSTPYLSASYRYHISPRFLVGGDVGFQSVSWKPDMGSTSFTTIMPLAEYYYLNKPNVKLYGNAMVGLGLGSFTGSTEGTTSGAFPSFQLNPIGVRIGKNYGGFLEVGAGLKGIFSAGFSAKF